MPLEAFYGVVDTVFRGTVRDANGGKTTPENLQTLCQDCNLGKGRNPALLRLKSKETRAAWKLPESR